VKFGPIDRTPSITDILKETYVYGKSPLSGFTVPGTTVPMVSNLAPYSDEDILRLATIAANDLLAERKELVSVPLSVKPPLAPTLVPRDQARDPKIDVSVLLKNLFKTS